MHWTLLFLAAILEIVWAVGLKFTEGFTRLWPSVAVIATMAASMGLLALAARGLPIGTAYAVWTGIGAAGTAIAGIILFQESVAVVRLGCLALIVAGVVGLKFFAK
jgi:quaternary ammonium compound-resistance protein SugE